MPTDRASSVAERRDDEHDAGARDDAAEHVARQLVATEQIRQPRVRIDRARRRVLHFRDLAERIEKRDPTCEYRREQPEADQQQAREPGPGPDHMTVEPELAAKAEAHAENDREARPDRKS